MSGRVSWLVVALLACGAFAASAQQGRTAIPAVMLEGIVDGEAWATDSGSTLLSRDNGHPSPVGRVQLFGGWTRIESN